MGTYGTHFLLTSLAQIFILCQLCLMAKVQASNRKVSGFYVFGDSTVDPGNNNNINTAFRSNFPPYGRDFLNQLPTGRFTNGKLATDYIASYIGLKKAFLPPYLDQNLSIEELLTGVSFASAGSGFDPLTPSISNVIPIPKQLEYFRECKTRLEVVLGKQGTENHIQKAAFFLSAGTNDFVLNYFTLPIRRNNYTLAAYQQFLIQHVKEFIQQHAAAPTSAGTPRPGLHAAPSLLKPATNREAPSASHPRGRSFLHGNKASANQQSPATCKREAPSTSRPAQPRSLPASQPANREPPAAMVAARSAVPEKDLKLLKSGESAWKTFVEQ